MPPKRCAVVASAWVNSSNSFACCSGGHADASIGDGKLDPVAAVGHPARLQLDLALLRELAGIAQQIEQDLPQPHGVDRQSAEVLLRLEQPGGSCSARQAGARCRSPLRSAVRVARSED